MALQIELIAIKIEIAIDVLKNNLLLHLTLETYQSCLHQKI
jgi:hypothetical protein